VALFYMHLAVERRTLLTIAITPLLLCAFLVFMLAPDHTHMTRMQTQKPAVPEPAHGH
jgi:cytochrome c oxidase subunit IV